MTSLPFIAGTATGDSASLPLYFCPSCGQQRIIYSLVVGEDGAVHCTACALSQLLAQVKALCECVEAVLKPRKLRKLDPCEAKRCSYYIHYLPQGMPELDHDGYHAAEAKCQDLQDKCMAWHELHPSAQQEKCPFCTTADFWESRIRA